MRAALPRLASLPAVAVLAVLATSLPAHAQSPEQDAVAATVRAYHDALKSGNADAAKALLADDVLVAESGGLETREEYLSHHLPGDMAFAAAVDRKADALHVTVEDDVAWAVSTFTTSGSFRERDVNSRGAELMVLTRHGDQWRIRAIHWSSRPVR